MSIGLNGRAIRQTGRMVRWRRGSWRPRTAFALGALVASGFLSVGVAGGAAAAVTQPVTWNATQARVPGAQAIGHDGAGVVVAIVDGWVDSSHPDFAGGAGRSRVLPGADCRSGTCVAGPAAPDACGHGTHVAGIIASSHYGVAPASTILPIASLSAGGPTGCTGSAAAIVAGIDWAAAHGAQIVNLSLGDDSGAGQLGGPGVTAAIGRAAAHGILVVVAAGNDGTTSNAPGYGTAAITVAATGADGRLTDYTDRGAAVQLAAPGGNGTNGVCTAATCVASTWLDHQYALLAGTSMAAPVVAGTAALLLGANHLLTRERLLAALESTGRPLAGTQYGLLDATAAARLAVSLRAAQVAVAPATPPVRAPHAAVPGTTNGSPGSSGGGPGRDAVSTPGPTGRVPVKAKAVESTSATGGYRAKGPWELAVVLLVVVCVALGWTAPRWRAPAGEGR